MDVTVWKFRVPAADTAALQMPQAARILHVALQDNLPCVWALCDPDAPLVERGIRILATGERETYYNADPGAYIGTIRSREGFVFHFFDLGETG